MADQEQQMREDSAENSVLPPSGVVVVDKPQGVTSHDIVAAMRSVLHTKKVGHAGTLDPMATGVLVVGYGQATRLLNAIVGTDKTYEATIRFGQATDSDDADGSSIEPDWQLPIDQRNTVIEQLTQDALQQLIDQQFIGEIQQIPNTYSAIKVHGQRAYDLARQGKEVELEARPVSIHACEVLAFGGLRTVDDVQIIDDTHDIDNVQDIGQSRTIEASVDGRGVVIRDVRVTVTCSAGTYIRALARDLGKALGVGAHLVMLRRTRVGMFTAVQTVRTESAEPDDTAYTEPAVRADSGVYADNTGYTNHTVHDDTIVRPVLPAQVYTRHWNDRDGNEHQRLSVRIPATDTFIRQAVYTPLEVVQHTMPSVQITDAAATDARFGRKIDAMSQVPQQLLPGTILAAHTSTELVAFVRVTRHRHLQPVTVFASE